MIVSALRQVYHLTLSGGGQEPSNTVVVMTGLGLVFSILIVLTLILTLQGKLFASMDAKKKVENKPGAEPMQPAMARPEPPAPAPVPVVQDGIPPEVVAAIAAAVAQIEGGRYTLRTVSTVQQGRGQWGLAGVISYTEPF